MADLISVSDVITEFGAYYIANRANKNNLRNQIFQGMETPSICTSIITDSSVYEVSGTQIGEVLQPYQDMFTKKGDLTFNPKTIPLRQMKIDWEDNPSKLFGNWLGFLADNNVDRKQWPFIKWLIENKLIFKSREDRELQAYFKGVYAAPTPGTAGAANTVMDGIKKQIDDGLTAATINQITLTGGLTASNIFDQVEAFANQLPDTWEGRGVKICMSKKWAKAYLTDKRNTLGVQPSYEKGSGKVDFTDTEVKGLASMSGSDYIFATIPENLVHIKNRKNAENFQVEGSKRTVSIYSDWSEAIGFLEDDLVYAYAPTGSGSGS